MTIQFILYILLTTIGFAMLVKCANFLVDGSAALARNLKVSALLIGLTVVAFGTSAPELAISFNSHLSGNTDILFGNVIGSNIVNILVILGLAVLIVPFKVKTAVIRKEIPILLLVTAGFSVLFLDSLFLSSPYNGISRADGIILILFFSIFVYYLKTIARLKDKKTLAEQTPPKYTISMSALLILVGLVGIVFGSYLVVDNLSALAEAVGISQRLIAVTIIAIGTSLPELVTTIVAAKKHENDIAIGNIVGANIFNIAIVLGLPVALLGGTTTTAFGIVDIAFLLLAVILLWIFTSSERRLKRHEGAIFIAIYLVYAGWVLMQA
jgi:cation:H+ antiporter